MSSKIDGHQRPSINPVDASLPSYLLVGGSRFSSFLHTPCLQMIKLYHAFFYGIRRETILARVELTNPCYLVAKLRFVVSVD